MGARHKRRPKQAALDSVMVKVERAKAHLEALQRAVWAPFPDGKYVITPEIYDQGLKHVYKADHPPPVDPAWSAIAGDCVHNLRVALDHLAYGLSACPNNTTTFPIWDRSRYARDRWRPWRKVHLLPEVGGGATLDVRKVLDVVQPYSRPGLGLRMLRELDNIDKHRTLLVVQGASSGHITAWNSADPDFPPPSRTQFTGNPLEHGEVIAVVTYERPYNQPDKELYFLPHVEFRDAPAKGKLVLGVLSELAVSIEDNVLPLFKPFL